MTEVVGRLQYPRLNSVPFSRESDLLLEVIHLNAGDGKGSVSEHKTRKGESMAILLAILDFLFGCHHVHLSRVFTLQGETYRVCCDCGAKFAYSRDACRLSTACHSLLS